MKQSFIIQNQNHSQLLILFAGWGGEPALWSGAKPQGVDFMVCYDYDSLIFDAQSLSHYSKIHVLAWSMGVWAASHIIQQHSALPWDQCIALNGTPYPISDDCGIPSAIFEGTLQGLSPRNLSKFRRRMCGSAAAMQAFEECGLTRSYENLHQELASIYQQVNKLAQSNPLTEATLKHWTLAWACSGDAIFPPVNQQNAWQQIGTTCHTAEGAHYDAAIFETLLNIEWTKN